MSERILDFRRQFPNGLQMAAEGIYPIPDDLAYLDAMSIRLAPSHSKIMLAGCLDEYIYLTHEVDDSGVARIRVFWGGPDTGAEELWSGSVASEDEDVERHLEALIASQYQELRARYLASANHFDRLVDQMARNRDVVQVYCDENVRYVQTTTSIYYEGEDSDLLTTFLGLCHFEAKVVANNGDAVGVKFPHGFQEIGPLLVMTGLVRRLGDSMEVETCPEVRLDQQWGQCQQPIGGEWYARFTWSPVCPDGEGSEDGC